jgi:hypothetical protein
MAVYLFGAAILALCVPFLLERLGKGDYDRDEGMSFEDWAGIWRKLKSLVTRG